MLEYKMCLLGDGAVGKTAMIIQLCSNKFVEDYDPTIEDCYRKQMTVDNKVGMLDILDTTGQEEFTVLRDQWISDCEGFLIVYSITSLRSFDQMRIFHDYIYQVKEGHGGLNKTWPIVIVGNKSDLESDREVPTVDGVKVAAEFNCQFLECSAKTRDNIEEVFCLLVRAIREYREGARSYSDDHEPHKRSSQKLPPSSSGTRKFCQLL